jgi:hypothetical protein
VGCEGAETRRQIIGQLNLDDYFHPQKSIDRLGRWLQLHAKNLLTDRELASDVIYWIAHTEEADRPGLVREVATMVPESVLREVEFFCGEILAPGAAWLPISLSAWNDEHREHTILGCRQAALEFRRQ